jgi:hypothetical protein
MTESQAASQPYRDYLFIAVASLVLVALVLLSKSGGNLLVLLALIPAFVGFITRSTFMPMVFLVMLVFLNIFPDGNVFVSPIPSDAKHFRIVDMAFVLAATTYFVSLFRFKSLKTAILPATTGSEKTTQEERPRQVSEIETEEYAYLFGGLLAFVFMASLVWLSLSSIAIDPTQFPPFLWADDARERRQTNRFLLLVGLLGTVTIVLGLLFSYWRHQRLMPAVARQYLLDTAWRENRRELNRLELWRAWGRGQLAASESFRPRFRTLVKIAAFVIAFGLALLLGRIALGLILDILYPR